MKDTLREKLDVLVERNETINQQLSDPEVLQQPNLLRDLSIELAEISEIVRTYETYRALDQELGEVKLLVDDSDEQIQAIAAEEVLSIETQLQETLDELQRLLLPKDPNDNRNIFLEVRAGTGGDEAAIFAGDLLRMYKLFVQNQGWTSETVSQHEGEHGGFKVAILRVIGKGAYSKLKFESGTHRVQRVPKTETQGRIHTSACTVAILPEADKIDDVDIDPQDLRVDTSTGPTRRYGSPMRHPGLWLNARMSVRNTKTAHGPWPCCGHVCCRLRSKNSMSSNPKPAD